MPDSVHGQMELSREALLGKAWEFGNRSGRILTRTFRFGDSGKIEGHSHNNEAIWALRNGAVEIYKADGSLMWRSADVIVDKKNRLCITLRTSVDPSRVERWQDVDVRLYRVPYGARSNSFCGGAHPEAMWIHKADLIAVLRALGFVTLLTDQESMTPHGKAACFFASRRRLSEDAATSGKHVPV
jgi:hypothetical protein